MRFKDPLKDSIRDTLPVVARGVLSALAGKIFELFM
ncbi:hypothetical protein K08M3_46960 [Vibrio alginolyticus]|uniref:Uncharacterized protein n=1 Tax=Vibrio alginolyticus TaxID=663 RepID=A0A1W6TKP4_VIBAL|nr:hypothetical protein K01M1_46840 [Vibrio alginolyticus]ARP06214.1 hypothetical protein K04M1_46830 [Vibrio alginolyticus]ARP11319.1 hypothetical protein K04M3_47420 [Vibrio alginolyticus]ARP16377.1 hypothetical protein K04M5_47170 [Vibrio alginolyticus]ARP21419.1 hypothetical protein K05K4_47020 [Vibrio alginolyticus]